ncbi:hypothetical protein DPEC_G00180230 [Dallia pectoralis]|uniref:Uncharacterized protein n=1 Tax=Dallia pectoralis TaxID=75939 RepID=A0ACC2G9M9_DALPE|nr:hypothetical protein DPEC_G00180230 [Dallia pectoralis]
MDEPQPEAEDFGTSSRWRCSALEAVLSSCCPAHRALLQQVLRFAHQQHHLSLAYRDVHRRPVPPPGPLCCHLVAKPLDATASPHHSAFPFIGCRSATGAPSGVRGCCCVQRCRLPAVCICLNSLHCLSCQSLGHVCSSTASSLCPASSLYPLASVCCPHPKPRPCTSCCPERTSLTSLTNAPQGGGRECPVLKREQSRSPSPPPLSPMPSDMQQEEERPPCLHPHQEECPIETPGEGQQAAGSSIGLQDLVERFSQKLKTIRPQEKDLNSGLVSHNLEKTNQIVAESQNLDKTNQIVAESQVNTHLSDIINTVLRTGSGNDYSLSDMLHRHESNGKQSPQTRSRRRQEAKAAMTTDKPSTRRHIVLVKRDLARLDESLGRKRLLLVRSQTATPEPTPVMEEKAGVERVKEIREAGLEEMVLGVAEKVEREAGLEEKVLGVVEREAGVEEKVYHLQENPIGRVMSCQESRRRKRREMEKEMGETLGSTHDVSSVSDRISTPQTSGRTRSSRSPPQPGETSGIGNSREANKMSSKEVWSMSVEEVVKSFEAGRSRRKIIPPQRFASYVTEPRKMYFAACFSESIFSAQRTTVDQPQAPLHTPTTTHIASVADTATNLATTKDDLHLGSSIEIGRGACRTKARGQSSVSRSQGQVTPVTANSSQKQSPSKHLFQNRGDVMEAAGGPYRCLRSSPVKPCRSGSQSTRPPGEVFTEPLTEQLTEPLSQPMYTGPKPHLRCTPQYSSPIKLMFVTAVVGENGVRGEGGSPPKNSPLSMNASPPIHESTPLKRRPGRPKKLGPQLEKKAKRPIGRPPKQKGVDQSEGSRKDGRDQSSCSSVDWIGPARPGYQGTNLPNRNLMITVVYGRSRRTKRTVSEDAAHLQVTQQQGDAQSQPRNYRANPEKRSFPATIKEQMEDFILPVKERKFIPNALHTSKSNIKYQKLKHVSAMRRPGRPAKVKISGISVTVTTVSPRQRKIHMNRTDSVRKSIETHHRKKALLPKPCLSKEPMTISAPLSEDVAQTHETEELKDSEFKPQNQTTSPLAVRHSVRVRKPSVYLLHSVATSSSRSRSHSTALLRRSRQLLLSKASSEGSQRRRLEEAATQKELHTLGPKVQHSGREDGSEGQRMMCEELQQVAEMSVESIFLPSDSEALRWWPVSSDQESLNEELARRINLMSHSWISSTTVPHTTRSGTAKQRLNGLSSWMPSEASAVRLLFDRCCSVEKLASWFMQTTETQSLGIVKKTSSRNPYELLHYACSTTRGSVCPSPQADRLRKHVKKFAKAVPKSPAQLHLAQKTLRHGKLNAKRCLFTPRLMPDLPHQSTPWRTGLVLGAYRTTLLRVKDKFLPRSARMNRANQLRYSQAVWTRRRQVAAAGSELGQVRPSAQTRKELPEPPEHHHNPLAISSPETLTTLVGPTQQGATKQMRLRSKAWSPETLQECRVFLKKINSPDTESVAEEWGVCTVELDEIDCTNGSRQEEEPGKMGRKKRTRKVLLEESSCLEQLETENQEQDQARNRRSKRKSPRNTMRQSSPSPKVMRQSRGKGLTGPRWRDFVLGT